MAGKYKTPHKGAPAKMPMHKMPGGHIMKGSDMKKMMPKGGKGKK